MSLNYRQQDTLVELARRSVAHGLEHGRALAVDASGYDAELQVQRATFVTLQIEGRLRGCIGTLSAVRPLVADVAKHAYAAAFEDSRFAALSMVELEKVDIEISVLQPSQPVEFRSEPDLLTQLRPGFDGLTIALGEHRATFLPKVWESLPEPASFLAQLKKKAGMAVDANGYSAWRYHAETIPHPAP